MGRKSPMSATIVFPMSATVVFPWHIVKQSCILEFPAMIKKTMRRSIVKAPWLVFNHNYIGFKPALFLGFSWLKHVKTTAEIYRRKINRIEMWRLLPGLGHAIDDLFWIHQFQQFLADLVHLEGGNLLGFNHSEKDYFKKDNVKLGLDIY